MIRKLQIVSILLVLLLGLNVTATNADSLGYDPITIYTEDCDVNEEQTTFFDILIQVDENRLLSVMNDFYIAEYSNGENFAYHDIEGYDSYLAFYPGAEFASVSCYMSAYTFLDSDITEYKLVAFDSLGDVVELSETFGIDDVGYQESLDVVKYYEYDYDNQTFSIVESEVDPSVFGQTIDFVGGFILSLIGYFIMAFIGILPFMIYSKKLHKEEYIETLLVGNTLVFLGFLLLLGLNTNGLLVFGLILLVYVSVMIYMFNKLNKKFNPAYKLNDLLYILLGYLGLCGLIVLILL